jgi:hypothetical protein
MNKNQDPNDTIKKKNIPNAFPSRSDSDEENKENNTN